MEQKLHTPEGVRDIYQMECRKKIAISNQLQDTLHTYGYSDIQTPTFEYFDVFRKEIGTIESRDLYKFFDKEGNTLVLRPDITPSIARAASTYYEDSDLPARLCYMGNTFINHSNYKGRLRENTQLGAENIGDGSVESDAEMIAIVADCLKSTGLTEFQISVGHVEFLKSLLDTTGLEDEALDELKELINNRNYFGVEELLLKNQIPEDVRNAFQQLPNLFGGREILDQAMKIAPNEVAKEAISRLISIYRILTYYGVEDTVNFDLSMSGNYMYYTGIIFRAYTYGTGDAVVRGGRYDHLLEKFGRSMPAIGFAIIVDELAGAINRQKIEIETSQKDMIIYTSKTVKWAISLAKSLRDKGNACELLKRQTGDSLDTYIVRGQNEKNRTLYYLNEDATITVVNLASGQMRTVK